MSRPPLDELRAELLELEAMQEQHYRRFGANAVLLGDRIYRARVEIELAEAEERPFRFLVRSLVKRWRRKGGSA